ncbi:hypothetical protein COU74_00340 [Candidatus Peregrinibacteria bacterium CG10_big_fil_rev_8_21_14_0_10_36_19]|nr:MAG: hypothetical protein COU74_00340 [Candidatus Peregrinibacteria bacterium CG10_big_fil_rev_8_21_14_0_10_36_19]
MTQKSYYDHEKIAWRAPEYMKYRRGLLWKVIAVLLLTVSSVLGYLYISWTFSLALVVFALVYSLLDRRDPEIIDVIISDLGVKVGNKKYPFAKIQGFWVIYNPPYVSTLNLRIKGHAITDVEIQLLGQDPSKVRDLLIAKIPEYEGKDESFIDVLLNVLKI